MQREWKNVKKQGVDGVFYNEGFLDESIIATAKVRSDQIGAFQYTFLSATG